MQNGPIRGVRLCWLKSGIRHQRIRPLTDWACIDGVQPRVDTPTAPLWREANACDGGLIHTLSTNDSGSHCNCQRVH